MVGFSAQQSWVKQRLIWDLLFKLIVGEGK